MKTRNLIGRAAALALALLLSVQTAAPALAEGDTIYIRTAGDLVELAENCSLDAWSRGRTVVLAADVSLSAVDFSSIPTFGGTFDGGGHAISGLAVTGRLSPAGFFGILQEGAAVRNLRISGSVAPAGTGGATGGVAGGVAGENRGLISGCSFSGTVTGKDGVGGIAGRNAATGRIENCAVTGGVTGSSMTGGIVGKNEGVAASCENRSYVNITSLDPGLDLSELELSTSLFTLQSLDAVNIATDTGGVAGYSEGMLLGCVNEGMVGYRHVGYNVGGIAGRSSGLVSGCTNRGRVFGRKDIAGVVGQAEPCIVLDLSPDTLSDLRSQLSELERLVDQAAADAQSVSAGLSARFSAVNECLDAASGQARTLSGRLSGYGGDVVSEVDRGGDLLADALNRLSDIADDAGGIDRQITRALDRLERAARELADTGGYTGSVAAEMDAAADNLSDASDVLDSGMTLFRQGLAALDAAVRDLDRAAARAAVDVIRQGLDILRNGTPEQEGTPAKPGVMDSLRGAAAHLRSAMDDVQGAAGQAQTAVDTLADAIGLLSDASDQGETALDGAEALIDFLAEADPIQLARPDEAIGTASDNLFATLDLLGTRLDALNGSVSPSADRLAGDVRAINSQFGALMDTLLDAAGDLEDPDAGDKFTDTSDADIDAVVSGKIRACANEAEVCGDLCVGGVAGSMAVEYELDPEDDALNADAPSYRKAYELKAILQDCVNTGAVLSRRDYAGGICGRVSLGLITACEGYGPVRSESGDYVGGIAGFSTGSLRNCWAKCTLSGGKYVGGVVGSAAVEGDADGGVVTHCRSFVRIPDCEQYAGAVSGVDRGAFRDNLFASDTLAGIGQVSLAGKAEPRSYKELIQEADAPLLFRRLTLRFLADGETVKTVTFQYGDSFDESVFPAAPEKAGNFAEWDTGELTDLRFDTDVTAVYTPYITALPSAEKRSDDRPVLFVEGRFDGGAALSLQSADEGAPAGNTPASLRRTVEQWALAVPEDGQSVHTLRYLSPNGSPNGLEVYSLQASGWKKLAAQSVGSYLVFDVEGAAPVVAVVSRTAIWWIWLVALAVLAALAPLARLLWKRFKRGGKKVREANNTPAPRKKKPWILMAVCAVLVCLVGFGTYFVLSGGLDSAAAANLLYQYAKRDEFGMDLAVQADIGERRLSAGTELLRVRMEERRVTVARQLGAAAYYSDGMVYLENGAAFQLDSGAFPDYAALLGTVKVLYQAGDIQVFKNEDEKIYSLEVEGGDARMLLRGLFPAAEELAALEKLDVDLTARSGSLSALRFTADGVLSDGTPVSLSAVLSARDTWESPEIPSAVREAILGGVNAAENSAGLLRLLKAWGKLNLTDPLSAQLTLSADCGPLVLNEELELFRTWVAGKEVACARKAGYALYFSGGKIYTESGTAIDASKAGDAVSQTRLLELAYGLCLQGQVDCAEQNGGYRYRLRLSPEQLAEAAQTLLPAVKDLDAAFTEGTLELEVEDDTIQTVRFSCGGTLAVLFAGVRAGLSGELRFEPREFSVPDAVADAVKQK